MITVAADRLRSIRVASEGLPFIAGGVALGALLAPVAPRLAFAPLAFSAASAYFFRDPERPLPSDPSVIVAAADGTITRVDTVDEPRFIKGPALRVVTFLSLFDVHINRVPVGGTVRYLEHIPGDFRAAWDAEADQVNERNYIGLETPFGPVLMIQIAGLVARRIVCKVQTGSNVDAGARLGLIRFGSRTDVLVPHHAARALVVPGVSVSGGMTPIGIWR
jgi:phosphatidylserine decarboxylase